MDKADFKELTGEDPEDMFGGDFQNEIDELELTPEDIKKNEEPLSQEELNKLALERLATFYKDQNLPSVFSDDPKDLGASIGLVGIRCIVCKGHVTANNLKFYNFSEKVKCYSCSIK